VAAWLEAGSRMVIVVNPRSRSVIVYHCRTDMVRLTGEGTLDEGEVVPGWPMLIKEVFA
jgi:hypothetical protein